MSAADEGSPLVAAEKYGNRLRVFDECVRPVAAEFVAVTMFVFIGSLSIFMGDIVAVAFGHGLTIMLLVVAFGHLSGAHVNPAVTLGALIAGAISWPMAVFYFAGQMAGSLLGSSLCLGVLNFNVTSSGGGEGQNAFVSIAGGGQMLGDGVPVASGLLCEVVLTFLLVLVVLMAAVDSDANMLAPLAIGSTIIVDILAGGDISGASMNPARSFGPAVLLSTQGGNLWTDQWVYWLGPAMGAILAAISYRFFFIRPERRTFLKDD